MIAVECVNMAFALEYQSFCHVQLRDILATRSAHAALSTSLFVLLHDQQTITKLVSLRCYNIVSTSGKAYGVHYGALSAAVGGPDQVSQGLSGTVCSSIAEKQMPHSRGSSNTVTQNASTLSLV